MAHQDQTVGVATTAAKNQSQWDSSFPS